MYKSLNIRTIKNITRRIFKENYNKLPFGLVVRIWRSHRQGPGSIPGAGKFFFTKIFYLIKIKNFSEYNIYLLDLVTGTFQLEKYKISLQLMIESNQK